ncbi:MAG TPA: DUF2844 domain-containing protein [Steroidobacteraceae bacterium]|nr:DUF2844 domain-containing protein [Steroidobacteraceae bacterium]
MPRGRRRPLALLSLIACAAFSPLADAALGDSEASVGQDAAKLSGTVQVMDHATYRVHQISAAAGVEVREFVNPQGKVFGVAWRGPTVPNLRATLGKYFDQAAAAAARSRHGDHNHLEIRQDDLVMQTSGHPRAFAGRAYLPSALPAGFDLTELR